jgi:hypothetical protein
MKQLIATTANILFDQPASGVFDAFLFSVHAAGYHVTASDPIVGTISLDTGPSSYHWMGQTLYCQVLPEGDRSSKLIIGSTWRKTPGSNKMYYSAKEAKELIHSLVDATAKRLGEPPKVIQIERKGCFIATAAAGHHHPHVVELCQFRDNWLLQQKWGPTFVQWYYRNGFHVAIGIAKSRLLQRVVFYFVVKPILILSRLLK